MIFLKGLAALLFLMLLLWIAATYCVPVRQARADDVATNCQAIRNLRDQYRGVELTEYEKTIRAQLVRYFRANCSRKRAARAKAAD